VDGLISTSKDYAFIGKFLDEKKTFKEFKAAIAANKKRTKEVLVTKDPAAKELEHQNTTLQMPFERIETDLKAAKLELLGIEKNINDKNEARREEDAKIEALRKEKYALENSASAIKNGIETSIAIDNNQPDETKLKLQQELNKDKKSIESIDENISQLDNRLANGTKTVEATQKELDAALALYDDVSSQWENENKSTIEFKEDDNICPTCQRPYEASNIAEKQKELVTRFNSNRRTALEALEKRGLALSKETIPKLKADIEKYNTGLSAIQIEIDAAKKSKDEIVAHLSGCELSLKNYVPAAKEIPSDAKLETLLLENKEYKDLLKKANDIQIKMDNVKSLDNSALIERKKELDSTIKEYEKDLLNKASISKNNKRIAEIRAEEKELNESLAELERQEYHMQQFVFKQMEDVQTKVNSMFNFVQFQMFDKQVNGEIIDACITLVDGKPIQKNAVNTAGEVNAGVDIINTLSKHYGVYLPMWVDNRESVTDLIPSETQVINLKVDPAYDTITLLP
jgi:DNA repair exonuclease SbcCD ATPase subunit